MGVGPYLDEDLARRRRPLHLGVAVVLTMMISLVTPPVGVLLFIMSSTPGHALWLRRGIGYAG